MIRAQLAISRDMPFVKVVRCQEEDAKGVKPIIVTFEKQTVRDAAKMVVHHMTDVVLQDRAAVLQKSKSLRGSSIVISEDFPRDIMAKRRHLIKFAKQVRHNYTFCKLQIESTKLRVNVLENQNHRTSQTLKSFNAFIN